MQHPVTWQPSADGNTWIGHMILKKTVLESGGHRTDSSAILGVYFLYECLHLMSHN